MPLLSRTFLDCVALQRDSFTPNMSSFHTSPESCYRSGIKTKSKNKTKTKGPKMNPLSSDAQVRFQHLHTGTREPPSCCVSGKLTSWVGAQLYNGAKRLATAGEHHAAHAERANNLFKSLYSPLQSADRFGAETLGPDE